MGAPVLKHPLEAGLNLNPLCQSKAVNKVRVISRFNCALSVFYFSLKSLPMVSTTSYIFIGSSAGAVSVS